jgi:hypothetical protein
MAKANTSRPKPGTKPAKHSTGTKPPAEIGDLGMTIAGNPKDGQTVTVASDETLMKLFGTKHPEQANAFLRHCLKVLKPSEASDDHGGGDERFFMVSTVADIKPRDAVERMLAIQIAATHVATIRAGGMLARADQLPQYEAHERAFNKLARTFTAQMEALRKHRNGGKQTVTVQHVNVADGGQAIVGDVRSSK